MADDKAKTQEIKKEETKEEKPSSAKASEGKKVSANVGKLVDEIAKLTVLELSDLTSSLQEKLGVSAAPIAAAPVGVAPSAGEAPQAGGESTGGGVQTVSITNAGANKIGVIKALREINQNLTLMDAKNITENVPAEVLKDAKAEDAKSAVEKLKAAGATVEVK